MSKPILHFPMSNLKTVCLKDLPKIKVTDSIEKVTCPACAAGIRQLFATGGN